MQTAEIDDITARIEGNAPVVRRQKPSVELIEGDCREVLKEFADNSLDAVVTDPPYGLEFMGKHWDYDVPGTDIWREVLRVLKPGGHLLSFGGSRTYHRMAVAIEDAGFEIRDQIMWIYGSGFPKSSNQDGDWDGWGTALKPAHEPIVVARKPLIGTMARNLAAHGVGALNIDGCRVEGAPEPTRFDASKHHHDGWRMTATGAETAANASPLGRWPANVIHDGSDEVLGAFPHTASGTGAIKKASSVDGHGNAGAAYGAESRPAGTPMVSYGDSGSAARFFYCAKASKQDRDDGLTTPEKPVVTFATANGTSGKPSSISEGRNTAYRNTHPTVKPTALMRYLCRLVTPPGGTVLDPFMGSGSTGRGAVLEGFNFIGIEMDATYYDFADQRIAAAEKEVAK